MNLADMMTRSGTLPPSGSICRGVSKCSAAGTMAPSSRAWDSARATRSGRLGSNISGTNTVADAGTARRRASYDPGAGRRVEALERPQHAVEALGAVADEEFEQTA